MSFLQSAEWEEIQRRYGRKTARISAGGEDILCVKNDLRFGFYYWYSPRPFISDFTEFVDSTEALIKDCLFFKLEPANESRIKNQESSLTHNSKFMLHDSKNLQPRETILIDLKKSDDELLRAMREKTRYNIRLAERHDIIIESRAGKEAIEDFYALLKKTAERDKFSLHPEKYYECLLFSNSEDFENRLFFAIYKREIAAAAMVNFYKGVATYLHGALNYELRNVMGSYLLHREIMKEAKRRGLHTYDFGGIDEVRWPGVTRFKSGFGGRVKAFPRAFDVTSRPLGYKAYQAGAFLTRFVR